MINNTRGAVVELVLVLVVGLMLLAGIYVYTAYSGLDSVPTPTPTPFSDSDLGTVGTPTPTPSPLPEVENLPTDSGDEGLDQTAAELNTLLDSVDQLDNPVPELNDLEADFSLPF